MAEEKNEAVEGEKAVEETPVAAAPEESPIPPEQDEIDALRNAPELVEVRGVVFKVCAVAMDLLPELQKELLHLDGMSPEPGEIVAPESITAMAKVARMGLERHHPHLTVARIEKMPIGCFPKILMATLNLNDFFDGMKTVTATGEAVAAATSKRN